jgi:hypothetical protein
MTMLIVLALILCVIFFFYGFFLLLMRPGFRKRGAGMVVAAPVIVALLGLLGASIDAKNDGWPSMSVKAKAEAMGITDPVAWSNQLEANEAAKALAEATQAEADAAKAEAEQAAKELAAAAKAEADAAKAAAEKVAGFHCLSAWDGSHPEVIALLEKVLRDPDSFEHDETRIAPVDENGKHLLAMTYRARNGFGGMNKSTAMAEIDTKTCVATLMTVE